MQTRIHTQNLLDEGGTRYLVEQLVQRLVTGNIDLSGYVKTEDLQAAIDELDINIDLSDYATEQYVREQIAQASLGGTVDLSAYALKTDLNTKADVGHTHTLANITDYSAPDLSGYATEQYVDNKIAGAVTNGDIDLSNYVTSTQLSQSISDLETQGYVKESWVTNQINQSIAGSDIDMSSYAKKEYANRILVPFVMSKEDWKEENKYEVIHTTDNVEALYDGTHSWAGAKLYIDKTKNYFDYITDMNKKYRIRFVYGPHSVGKGEITILPYNGSPKTKLAYRGSHYRADGSTAALSNFNNLYDIEAEDGTETNLECVDYASGDDVGIYENHWNQDIVTLPFGFEYPKFDYDESDPLYTEDKSINGKDLLDALIKCLTKIEFDDGAVYQRNELVYSEIVYPTDAAYEEYVASFNGQIIKDYVNSQINQAELGGDDADIDLSIYALKSEINGKANTNHTHVLSDITDYDTSSFALKAEVPSKTSELTNDSGFLTSHQSLDNYALISDLPTDYLTESDLDDYATKIYVDTKVASIPSGGSSGGGITYQSGESETNDTWIDGKKIWRYVLVGTPYTGSVTAGSYAQVQYSGLANNVDSIVDFKTIWNKSGMNYADDGNGYTLNTPGSSTSSLQSWANSMMNNNTHMLVYHTNDILSVRYYIGMNYAETYGAYPITHIYYTKKESE